MAVIGPLGLINTGATGPDGACALCAGLNIFKTALGIYALMSWLYAFGIVDLRNAGALGARSRLEKRRTSSKRCRACCPRSSTRCWRLSAA